MNLWQDVRFAARLLVKDRSFTVTAVIALALGISATNTVFTVVNAALLRDLPFDAPDKIVSLGTRDTRTRPVPGPQGYRGISYLEFQDWRDATRTFSGLAAYNDATMNVSDEGRTPERFRGTYISANGFRLTGQKPLLGRDFLPEDDRPGAPPVVILGDGIWRNRYGGDPTVIGRVVRVNGVPSTVIGIMPAGFQFPITSELWQPLALLSGVVTQPRDARTLSMFGRLADGVRIEQAQAELNTIAARLTRSYPDTNTAIQPTITPYVERHIAPQLVLVFVALMGAVGCVLLIACTNVANLLLARSTQRWGEISIRLSLGATRWRIVRQLLVESVLLAIVAGVVGWGLSVVGVRLFSLLVESFGAKPYWIRFTMDAPVFAFLAAVCLGTGVLFGLAPALHISKPNLNEFLREGTRGGFSGMRARRWTGALVIAELALTLVLLAGAGSFLRSFLELYRVDPGVETSGLMRMQLVLAQAKYPTPGQQAAFYQQLETRLNVVPGISAATLASALPLGGGFVRELSIEGRPPTAGESLPAVSMLTVGTRYFDTLGLRLLRGRAFLSDDGVVGREAAIVNERFVAMYFADVDPLGRRIRLTTANARGATPSWVTIVGISPTIRQRSGSQPDQDPVVYLPYQAQPLPFATLIVRSSFEPGATASRLREEVRVLDPDLPLFDIMTVDEWLAFLRSPQRVFGTLFAVFAGIALALAAVGLYGVTAYSVAQRTQEIGVRMALGAQARQVCWLVMRRAVVRLAIGLGIGLAGALGVGNFLAGVAWAGGPDPVTMMSITALLILVALAASFAPARRATRLNPVVALRTE